MSDILIRGVPQRIHQEIQKKAASQNLSVNQLLIQIIKADLERGESEREKGVRRSEAFHRIEKLREEILRQYGPQEDSTKIIREFRDKRNE